MHAHDTHLKAYLRTSFPTVRDVDDIVQESYLRIWRRQSVQPVRTAKAFLFTIARRLTIDWLRREKSSVVEVVENLEAVAVSEECKSTAEVVAYCRGPYCVLAAQAVTAFRDAGHPATRLSAGPIEWQAAGLTLAAGS